VVTVCVLSLAAAFGVFGPPHIDLKGEGEPAYSTPGDPISRRELARWRRFDEYGPLYFLGRSFGGFNLRGVMRWRDRDGADYVAFLYGSCVNPGTEGGCLIPVEVQVEPGCAPAGSLAKRTRLRGVPAFEDATGVWLYTGDVTVTIRTEARGELRRAIWDLRPIRGRRSTGGRLPPPLDCRPRKAPTGVPYE
jgi:hypothetical protein